MVADKRGENESYSDYRKRIRDEAQELKKRLKGHYVWVNGMGTAQRVEQKD